ncbi:hypothetical protein Rhe02_59700 [Rhizocola hellebori]|uniref:PKD domain-containing protein n=1 Tax=Rhizocola hellebori TaxID=1392758 RepID=A0A8J3VJE0_9ACTN|nr:hypothetical protein Rhe02_59700 [Rhizocola hellebori]
MLCWVSLIALAILIIHVYVFLVVVFFIALVMCEGLCVFIAVLQAPSGNIVVRCFQYSDSGTTTSPPLNRQPVAVTDGPYSGIVGQSISMSAAGSTDPEGGALSATWNFGDGQSGTGLTTSHPYSNVGVFNVTVSVSDGTYAAQATTTATINAVGGWNPSSPIGSDTM